MQGRVAVVTGGGSGIGRAFGARWVSEGGGLVAVDLDEKALAWTDGAGDRAVALAGDVTLEATNARMVELALERFGGLDVLILNAGMPSPGSLEQLPLEVFDRLIDVNLRSQVLGLRAALPTLRRSDSPAVVATASVSGLGADPGHWGYNTAKGGLVNFVRAAALDLACEGIRVNAVCPGPIRTGMTDPIHEAAPAMAEQLARNVPLQRWGEAEEVAAVIRFLASTSGTMLTLTWSFV